MLQWGSVTIPSQDTTISANLNIAYNQTWYKLFAIRQTDTSINDKDYMNSIWLYPSTTSVFKIGHLSSPNIVYSWLSIGNQQWGLKQTNTQYWYYPLTFKSYVFYANCRAIRNGASGDGWSWSPVAPTLSYARFLENDENAYCLSVGYQQWGLYNQPGVKNTDVTFAIAFPNNCWCCVNTCGVSSTTGAQAYGVYSRSKTKFVSTGYGCGASNTTYVAIGN